MNLKMKCARRQAEAPAVRRRRWPGKRGVPSGPERVRMFEAQRCSRNTAGSLRYPGGRGWRAPAWWRPEDRHRNHRTICFSEGWMTLSVTTRISPGPSCWRCSTPGMFAEQRHRLFNQHDHGQLSGIGSLIDEAMATATAGLIHKDRLLNSKARDRSRVIWLMQRSCSEPNICSSPLAMPRRAPSSSLWITHEQLVPAVARSGFPLQQLQARVGEQLMQAADAVPNPEVPAAHRLAG